jgi:HSP20 family protein
VSSDTPEPRPDDANDPAEAASMGNELVPHPSNFLPSPDSLAGPPASRVLYSPAMDIFETEEGLVLVADVPGVKTETLELQVQNNNLTLFGRVEDYTPQGAIAIHQEYGVGDFLRSFILPLEVDHDRISAKLSYGVLKVILPKAQRAEPRKISIDEGE